MTTKRWASMLLLAAAVAAQAQEETAERNAEGFGDVQHWVERFEAKDRREWQQPDFVVLAMGLAEGDRVADIGTGTGYFLPYLDEDVGESGRVYAVDIEPGMLEYVKQRQDLYWDNVVTVLATPDDPKLPDGELDAILIVNTWHHIEDREAYLAKLAKALAPGGRLFLVDWLKKDLPLGPPPEHKLGREEVLEQFGRAGWKLSSESVALPYQYFLVLNPPR